MPLLYKNILLIDDDADDQDLFVRALISLHDDHLYWTVADHGLDALDKIKLDTPDIIFVDMNMPIMSGFEFLHAIKKDPVYEHIPCIVMTTSTRESDAFKAIQLGAVKFITKPYSLDKLTTVIRETLNTDFTRR